MSHLGNGIPSFTEFNLRHRGKVPRSPQRSQADAQVCVGIVGCPATPSLSATQIPPALSRDARRVLARISDNTQTSAQPDGCRRSRACPARWRGRRIESRVRRQGPAGRRWENGSAAGGACNNTDLRDRGSPIREDANQGFCTWPILNSCTSGL